MALAIRGRKPTPTHLKLLKGNPGHRPLNKDEPKPTPIAPKPPAWLDAEAKREWKRVAPELERLGLLTQVDGMAFAGYCAAVSRLAKAEKAIRDYYKETRKLTVTYVNKAGFPNEVPLPEIAIAREAAQQAKSFAVEFGLTPSSRTRLNPGKDKTPSDLMEFIGRGKKAARTD